MSIIEKALDKLDVTGSHKIVKQDVQIGKIVDEAPLVTERTIESKIVQKSRRIDLDIELLESSGYLTPNTKNRVMFEQYRRIKLPILKKAFNEEGLKNIVMLTSSLEGEGKSFTALNLAMSVAYEYNQTVLLVDADIVKKQTSGVLGLKDEPGLIDYLTEKSSNLSDLMLSTNIPNLNILPAGGDSDRITELFNSKKMGSLINELSKRYEDRLIILDAPPLLQETSSDALKQLVDQVVFVIEAEKTPIHIIKTASQLLDNVNNVGVVLNKSNQYIDTAKTYGYGYGNS